LVTLAGHFATAKEAQSYWNTADDNVLSAAHFRCLFDCLSPLYPANKGLQAVKPDLLGEALLGEILAKSTGPALLSSVLNKTSSNVVKLHALTVLARLSLYKPELDSVIINAFGEHLTVLVPLIVAASLESNSRLPELTIVAMGKLKSNEQNSVAVQFDMLIKHDSIALNSLNCDANRIIYEKAKKKFKKQPNVTKTQVEYTNILYDYALSLYRMGRNLEACVFAKQSIAIDRQLVKQDPAKYQYSYSQSLGNYALFLTKTGQIKTALKIEEQGLEIRERLAVQNPARYEAAFALVLGNYANHLSVLGQYREAIEYSKKALTIRERHAAQNPDSYQEEYAHALNSYAIILYYMGQHQKTSEFSEKALMMSKRLAEKKPDRFEASYAHALNCYSFALSEIGQYQEAIEYSKKAFLISKCLAEQNPDRYESDYAQALSSYATDLANLGQHQKAIECCNRSLVIRERMFKQNPDIYKDDYAESLNNYACHSVDLGQYAQAFKLQKKSCAITLRNYQESQKKHAFNLGLRTVNYQLTCWLAGIFTDKITDLNPPVGDDFLQHILTHRKPAMKLEILFIDGIKANTIDDQQSAFESILQMYPQLDSANKQLTTEYWHCAAVWLEHQRNNSDQLEPLLAQWREQWQEFKKRVNNNIPQWMLDYATKMDVKWP
jgi:tetratricopeptide (TPR) repeat protein